MSEVDDMAKKAKTGNGKYEDMREAAVAAVFTCASNAEASRVLGVSPSTLQRWKAKPDFQDLLAAKRETSAKGMDEAIRAYVEKVAEYGPESLDSAAEVMRSACRFTEDGELVGDHSARMAANRMLSGEFSKLMQFMQDERRTEVVVALAVRLGISVPAKLEGPS